MIKLIYFLLRRGMNTYLQLFPQDKQRLSQVFKDGYTICITSLNNDYTKCFVVQNGKFKSAKKIDSDLTIIFKSKKLLKKCMFGVQSIPLTYLQHEVIIKGNLNHATLLVELLNNVELFLFPHFITKKLLPERETPKGKLKFMIKTIF